MQAIVRMSINGEAFRFTVEIAKHPDELRNVIITSDELMIYGRRIDENHGVAWNYFPVRNLVSYALVSD